ncbi:MAG: hypothetical protein HYV18_00110 [Gammaproteobacteria bacterium]|nr:hypothetical protein [Gammaproteobacteria bacterium]
MQVLIGNIVKTQFADYPCASREEAEALVVRLREREKERRLDRRDAQDADGGAPRAGGAELPRGG